MTHVKKLPIGLACAVAVFGLATTAQAESFLIDLTHPIPTFKPMEGDPIKTDLNQPWLNSKPHPTFDQQAILTISEWPTNNGYFDSGKIVVDEHHGTHFDTPAHFLNTEETIDEGGIPAAERITAERDQAGRGPASASRRGSTPSMSSRSPST